MLSLTMTIQRQKPPAMSTREFNAIVRRALEETGHYWIKEYLPLHFGPFAMRRYKYAVRQTRYLFRKAHIKSMSRAGLLPGFDPLPNEYTGTMKAAALESDKARGKATSNKIRMEVVVELAHPVHRDHAGELVIVLKSEVKELNEYLVKRVQIGVNNFRKPETIRLAA